MSTSLKSLIAFVVAAGITLAIYGAYLYPKAAQQTAGTSAAGSTFGTGKTAYAAINLANPGANGTSTSISNPDANDRIVRSIDIGCEGVGTSKAAYSGGGLANLLFTFGTTSDSAPASYPAGFNKIGGVDYAVSTSTPNTGLASTTMGVSSTSIVWTAGSNLTIFTNATNTASCTAGVTYMPT